jgi:hypothetical protein
MKRSLCSARHFIVLVGKLLDCFGLTLLLVAVVAIVPAEAQNTRVGPGKGGPSAPTFHVDIPNCAGSVILGRPTKNSITVSLLLNTDADGLLVVGTDAKSLPAEGRSASFKPGEPQQILLDGLVPDTQYFYELRDTANRKRLMPADGTGTFHTARLPGSPFTFTITADSHLDGNTDPLLYQRTLANARADMPDFHIDLGDTFMTEKHSSRESAAKQYLAQRYYFGHLCDSAPLFLVLGNHDGEFPRGRGGEADSLAVWSNLMRDRYFPNPIPDGFYSGNPNQHPEAGWLEDYYAWEWGDALFVVLDPYWYNAKVRGNRDNWACSLGREQYEWLKKTLEQSREKFKFVFIHQLVGGLTNAGRGGVEAAPFFEWGGRSDDGKNEFQAKRPGWPEPIHSLLVRNHVTAVFHGHDHLFAKQELDGIVYQEVPQPGSYMNLKPGRAEEYGYSQGILFGGTGHLRVRVSIESVQVEYVQPFLSKDTAAGQSDCRIVYSYRIRAIDG